MLRAVKAKAKVGVCLPPSLKAGVNERQIVDNAILLVTKLWLLVSNYPSL